MNRPTIAAKGVSTSGRVKHTHLRQLPPRRRLDRTTLVRLRRGFISLRDLNMTEADL
jgi:hypothetical protein